MEVAGIGLFRTCIFF